MSHEHGAAVGPGLVELLVAAGVLAAAVGYLRAVRSTRERAAWPVRRTLSWLAGLGCVAAALVGPLAAAAHASFTAHAAAHVLLGMLGPLMLVLGAPVTLALRALPLERARLLSRVLRSPVVRVVGHPVVAGALNAGGLWLLYRSDLFALMHEHPPVHAAVHAHVFLAGYLFTAALVGVDPQPHRASLRVRSVVLVAFIALHSILAKQLYAFPPTGVGSIDGQVGAQVMYYAGDVVDVTLIVLLLAGWYRSTRPRLAFPVTAGTHLRPEP
ncbi:cytochrome c oxidase assembly protein [Desertivibrio insolitus]|uniref:cytochrome c oxidase assembly protein n=1 Tax=Herbiconiux sp. SYSU D00978 TaxID=2812562 RepID=UPI001A9659A1|nr:cytochrome c oxidase assembly protein [Herbiconiux sp. SYSU D00978]